MKQKRFLVIFITRILPVILSAAALGVAAWTNGIAAEANRIAGEANSVAQEANRITGEANRIGRASTQFTLQSIKPHLVTQRFISFSIDMDDEKDLRRIARDNVYFDRPLDWRQIEANREYAWLLVENKGGGLAKILTIKIPYSLIPTGDPEIIERDYTDMGGRPIGPGDILAVYLGYFEGYLKFTGDVEITYRSILDEPTPLTMSFPPHSIFRAPIGPLPDIFGLFEEPFLQWGLEVPFGK